MIENWEELKKECMNCKKCQLCETRTNVVFGDGNEKAKILFVGEGPGENEDLKGLPFIGRGGQLLDKLLDIVDLSRKKNIYIANIVKCRPPENRDPKKEEAEECINYLRNQVHIMQPKIIVCLGRVAATKIIEADFKVTKQHGEFFEKNGICFMGTFHPAALLRNPNNKPLALEDFQKLREKIKEICPEAYNQ
ncbi:MAG: uracil-DNA glycosylase [Oscillospiraceae bacterium]